MTNNLSESQMDPALERVLTECIEAIESGSQLSVDDWVNKYPQFAGPLRELILDHRRLDAIVPRLPAGTGNPNECTVLSGELLDETPRPETDRVRYFGDYELVEEIARGGMGVVFRARQVSLNRPVAVKMILSGEFASADDVARFRLEAEAAANLDHPGIVPIYEIGESGGQHYFSMKYIDGQSLAARLKRRTEAATVAAQSRDEIRESVRLVADVARAVHYAHQRGIIHRDLKPANILIDGSGRPHVTDFGLAKRMTGESQLTHSGAIVGTPSYMPPEQASGGGNAVTTAADIYGLGAILFAVLTGRPPFEGANPLETLQQVQNASAPNPSSVTSEVDRDLDAVCQKCLAKNPDDRYRSAGELADDLDRWRTGEPVQAAPPNSVSRVWRWLSANFRVAACVIALGALTGGLVVEPVRGTQAHNVGSYLGVYRGSFPDHAPPAVLKALANYSPVWGVALFLVGLACYFGMGWITDCLVRPKTAATAVLAGLALGSTAAVTAFFTGVGWSVVSQQAIWPVQHDLELLAATIDNDTTFAGGQRLTDTYPGVAARRVMKKALADLESNIPLALGLGLLVAIDLLILPAVVQTLAAFLLRLRGDGAWQRMLYLIELAIPVTIVLGGGGMLVYQYPALGLAIAVLAVLSWSVFESTRRWSLRGRRIVEVSLCLLGIGGLAWLAFSFRNSAGPFGKGGNGIALFLVAAVTASIAVVQRWPWWRYLVYGVWALTLLSSFTGPGFTIPNTPETIAQSERHAWLGIAVVLLLTGGGFWFCSRPAWQQRRSSVGTATPSQTADRRRRTMKQTLIVSAILLLAAVAIVVPAAMRFDRQRRLVDAIDACQPESLKQIRLLVADGADITTRGYDNTVAMVAAYWNDPNLLQQALTAGVDPNAADPFGNTALHFATFAPSTEPLRLLLAAGVDVNRQTRKGDTPLMLAVRNAQFDQIKLLLAAGAKADLKNEAGETALSLARGLQPGGPRPMRPDLTVDDFVRLLEAALTTRPE